MNGSQPQPYLGAKQYRQSNGPLYMFLVTMLSSLVKPLKLGQRMAFVVNSFLLNLFIRKIFLDFYNSQSIS